VIPASACAIGVRVTPDFADHPGEPGQAWTELVFRVLAGEAG
jgi:hypothetical protein